ncbi:MAG: hypothetical protein PHN64_03905 [Desulfovibrionaceae bacterium]|nr:hypothetical protein [Desulfovibrionaceae bacterium]
MKPELCLYCLEPPKHGVLRCTSPHWLAAGDERWRTMDGRARVVVAETCALCGHGEKRPLVRKKVGL